MRTGKITTDRRTAALICCAPGLNLLIYGFLPAQALCPLYCTQLHFHYIFRHLPALVRAGQYPPQIVLCHAGGHRRSDSGTTGLVLLGFATVQIVVHMVYFLHMNFKSEGGWTMLALIFTIMVVVIMLAGSLWVMYHLNHNMMPGSMQHNMSGMK